MTQCDSRARRLNHIEGLTQSNGFEFHQKYEPVRSLKTLKDSICRLPYEFGALVKTLIAFENTDIITTNIRSMLAGSVS